MNPGIRDIITTEARDLICSSNQNIILTTLVRILYSQHKLDYYYHSISWIITIMAVVWINSNIRLSIDQHLVSLTMG